jgi:predicted secreted protein
MRGLEAPDNATPVSLEQFFCGHTIHDGAGTINLELPPIVEWGVLTPVSIKVNWTIVFTKAVARLYLLADGHTPSLLAGMTLLPDIVPPHLLLDVRLERSTYLRAIVQCGDGTALQVKRWVTVRPPPALPIPGCPAAIGGSLFRELSPGRLDDVSVTGGPVR